MKPVLVITLCVPTLVAVAGVQAARAEDVDGRYKGTYSSTGTCSGGGPTETVVRDRTVNRRFGPTTQFSAKIGPDGNFSDQEGQYSMTGMVKGGHMEVDLRGGRQECRVHQVLDKE